MDDKTLSSPQLPVDQLSHTPEAGFTDIKPLQINLSQTGEIFQYSLIGIAIIFFSYLVYLQLRRKNLKQKKTILDPKEHLVKSIEHLTTRNLPFREHCELLTFIFKELISSILSTNLNHLTPRPFCERFLSLAKTELNETTGTIVNEMVEGSYKLLFKLENGEYSDDVTQQSLKDQKDALSKRVLELGNEIIKIFNQRTKEKSK